MYLAIFSPAMCIVCDKAKKGNKKYRFYGEKNQYPDYPSSREKLNTLLVGIFEIFVEKQNPYRYEKEINATH